MEHTPASDLRAIRTIGKCSKTSSADCGYQEQVKEKIKGAKAIKKFLF